MTARQLASMKTRGAERKEDASKMNIMKVKNILSETETGARKSKTLHKRMEGGEVDHHTNARKNKKSQGNVSNSSYGSAVILFNTLNKDFVVHQEEIL